MSKEMKSGVIAGVTICSVMGMAYIFYKGLEQMLKQNNKQIRHIQPEESADQPEKAGKSKKKHVRFENSKEEEK